RGANAWPRYLQAGEQSAVPAQVPTALPAITGSGDDPAFFRIRRDLPAAHHRIRAADHAQGLVHAVGFAVEDHHAAATLNDQHVGDRIDADLPARTYKESFGWNVTIGEAVKNQDAFLMRSTSLVSAVTDR